MFLKTISSGYRLSFRIYVRLYNSFYWFCFVWPIRYNWLIKRFQSNLFGIATSSIHICISSCFLRCIWNPNLAWRIVAIRFWRRAIEAEKEGVSLPAGQGSVDKADPSLSPRRQFLDFSLLRNCWLATNNKQKKKPKHIHTLRESRSKYKKKKNKTQYTGIFKSLTRAKFSAVDLFRICQGALNLACL